MCHCVSQYSFHTVIVAFAWVDALRFHQLLFLPSSLSHHPSCGSLPIRVKSCHTHSNVIVINPNNNMSLHSFKFSPFIFFPKNQWLNSYFDVAPQIIAFAWLECQPLLTAIRLLPVMSSVSLSIPFAVGKLIDYFTSANPVSHLLDTWRQLGLIISIHPQTIPHGFSLTQATAGVSLVFLQLEVLAKQDTPFSCTCLVCRVKDFSKRPSHLVPRSANGCLSAQTNLYCNPLTRSWIHWMQGGRCSKSTQHWQQRRRWMVIAPSLVCILLMSQKCYTEPFQWTPCCGDILCQPYTYISSCFGVYADQFVGKSQGHALHISTSHLSHACNSPSYIPQHGWYLPKFFLRVYKLTMA